MKGARLIHGTDLWLPWDRYIHFTCICNTGKLSTSLLPTVPGSDDEYIFEEQTTTISWKFYSVDPKALRAIEQTCTILRQPSNHERLMLFPLPSVSGTHYHFVHYPSAWMSAHTAPILLPVSKLVAAHLQMICTVKLQLAATLLLQIELILYCFTKRNIL